MAVRRPPAPRLQAGRPGAQPVPTVREQLAPEHAQPAQASPSPQPVQSPQPAQSARSAQSAKPLATGAVSGTPRRRALLLAGSVAAAVALPVTAGGLLARRGHDSPPAASSSGGGGNPADADLTSPFSDVADGAEGLAAMLWAEETGVQPAQPGAYEPDAPLTRGDLGLALYRFAGSPDLSTEAAPVLIADVGSDPLYARALLWLHGRGALWGDHELRVHPEAEATRRSVAQMVTALVRPALAGVGVSWDPATDSTLAGLPETEPSADEVHWLSAAGMLISAQESEGAVEWDGDQTVTRAHLAIILHRVDDVIASVFS